MREGRHRDAVRGLMAAAVAAVVALAALGAPTSSLAAPSQAELDAAKDRLMELERDFEVIVERYDLVRHRLAELTRRIAADELVVRDLSAHMSVTEAAADSVATELYKGGSTEAVEAVLGSQSLAEVEARLQYLTTTEDAQSRVFERLAADRRLLEDRIERLDTEKQQALSAERRLAELKDEIQAKLASQRDEIARLNELIERAERRRELRRQRAAAAAAAAAQAAATAAAPPTGGTASVAVTAPAPDPSSRAGVAVQAALAQVGDPYQWGAAGPDSFDCSGLTMYAWAQAGVSLPHSSAAQYAATARVSQGDWQPGDLLFYGSPIHHVAMYIGGGQVVEAPYTGASVRVASAARSDYVAAGRPGV